MIFRAKTIIRLHRQSRFSIGVYCLSDITLWYAGRMIFPELTSSSMRWAMFGATVLVPVITGLSVSATLLFAGLGTLLFHFLTKWKVPAFLGSSFAFLGGYAAVTQMGTEQGLSLAESLPYACIGVVCAGLMYFVLAGLFAAFGPKKVMRIREKKEASASPQTCQFALSPLLSISPFHSLENKMPRKVTKKP